MAILGLAGVALAGPAMAGPVTINDEANSLRTAGAPLVYDLDDGPGRTEAAVFVRQMHDRFFPKSELIDADATAPEVLKAKLQGGFILYGVLREGSSLPWHVLTGTIGPAKLGGGGLSTSVFAAAGEAFRLIFVGRNPYGDRPALVYAATSNGLVTDINALFHGPASYHVYGPGNQVLHEGSYNERFISYRDPLPIEDARKDAARFFATLESVHPDLLAMTTRQDFDRLRTHVDAAIVGAQTDGGIPVRSLAAILFQVAASFGDGHTSLGWFYAPTIDTDARTKYPPFTVLFRNGRFYVDKADRTAVALEAKAIVAVGGKPFAEFAGAILERCSGESLPFKAARFKNRQLFFWSLVGGVSDAKLRVTVEGFGGKPMTLLVPAIGVDAFGGLETRSGEQRSDRISWRFPDGDTCYFYYPSFQKNDGNVALIDAMFKEARTKQARTLIIDLRGNGGGNSSMSEVILKHLTGQKVRQYSKIRLKVSPEIMDRYPDDYLDLKGSIGQVVEFEEEARALPAVPALFTGKVFVLVDNSTFSSAADFAATIRGYGLGTLVGYETGGFATSFGDVYSTELEHSEIPFGVSHKQFFAAVPVPGDDRHGVMPDVPLTDPILGKYSSQPDPALAFVLDLAHGRVKPQQ